jgi:hypothetical protein
VAGFCKHDNEVSDANWQEEKEETEEIKEAKKIKQTNCANSTSGLP